MCECKYAFPSRKPTSAIAKPTIRSPSNAPNTCPPVCLATTNVTYGSVSNSLSLHTSRSISTHRRNSSTVSHFRISIPTFILSSDPQPVISNAVREVRYYSASHVFCAMKSLFAFLFSVAQSLLTVLLGFSSLCGCPRHGVCAWVLGSSFFLCDSLRPQRLCVIFFLAPDR